MESSTTSVVPGITSEVKPRSVTRLVAWITGAALAAAALLLYAVTAAPTITFTDSGELVTAAWTASIAHPPGYPLYTLLGWLWIHLPLGTDPAWRMNLLSGLFGAVAVGLFYGWVRDTFAAPPVTPPAPEAGAPGRARGRQASPARAAVGTARSTAQARRGTRGIQGASTAPRKSPPIAASPAAVPPVPAPSLTSTPGAEGAPAVSWAATAGALAGAGLLAVSLTFWNWATQAKFYGLHYIFVVALFWLGWRAHRALRAEVAGGDAPGAPWSPRTWSPGTRLLHAIVFLTGLALTNHFQTFLVLPGVAILVLTGLRTLPAIRRRLLRYAPTLVLAGLVPLLLYLYLPIRAGMQPLFAWGQPTTLPDFWRQVTAQNYQHLFSGGNLGTHLVDAVVYAANQFGPILSLLLLVPIAVGVRYLWGTHRSLLLATAVTAGLSLLVDVNYNIPEIATYYVPIYMIGLFWAGLGVAAGVRWLLEQAAAQRAAGLVRWASLPAGALLPLVALLINAGAAGHRDNYTAELFIQNAFKSLPPNAILLTDYWDLSSLSFYWQHVRGERTDVVVIDKELLRQPFYIDYLERAYPDVMAGNVTALSKYKGLLRHWVDTGQATRDLATAYTDTLNGFVDRNLGRRPVYTAFITPVSDTQGRSEIAAVLDQRRAQLVPAGLGYHIVAPGEDAPAHDPHFDFRGLLTDPVPLDEIERSVVAVYPGFVQQLSSYLQSHPDPADPQAAARLQAQAGALQPFKVYQDERPRLR